MLGEMGSFGRNVPPYSFVLTPEYCIKREGIINNKRRSSRKRRKKERRRREERKTSLRLDLGFLKMLSSIELKGLKKWNAIITTINSNEEREKERREKNAEGKKKKKRERKKE